MNANAGDFADGLFESIAQRRNRPVLDGQLLRRQVRRHPEPDDPRHVFRAGAAAHLLRSAGRPRFDLDTRRKDQCSHAHGTAKLVRRKRKKIGAERREVERDPARALHSVAMKQGAVCMYRPGDFGYRLNDAGFVVGQHDRDQRRLPHLGKGGVERVKVDDALSIDRGDPKTLGNLSGGRQN